MEEGATATARLDKGPRREDRDVKRRGKVRHSLYLPTQLPRTKRKGSRPVRTVAITRPAKFQPNLFQPAWMGAAW